LPGFSKTRELLARPGRNLRISPEFPKTIFRFPGIFKNSRTSGAPGTQSSEFSGIPKNNVQDCRDVQKLEHFWRARDAIFGILRDSQKQSSALHGSSEI
jgi:hypothetical protein